MNAITMRAWVCLGIALAAASACGQAPSDDSDDSLDRSIDQLVPVVGEVVATFGTAAGADAFAGRPLSVSQQGPQLVVVDGRDAHRLGRVGEEPLAPGPLGGEGEGPGEYTSAFITRVDPLGRVWIFDTVNARAVAYGPDGQAFATISTRETGRVIDAAFLSDGSPVVTGTGSTPENLGMMIHVYDFSTETWSSHFPELRNRSFQRGSRETFRYVAVSPDDRVVVIHPYEYTITLYDIDAERVVKQVSGAGRWWEDHRVEEGDRTRVPTAYGAHFDERGLLWVVGRVPQRDPTEAAFERRIAEAAREGREIPVSTSELDRRSDTFVEAIDLEGDRVVASFRLDLGEVYPLAPGVIAYYMGDLPYPRIQVVHIQQAKEVRIQQ